MKCQADFNCAYCNSQGHCVIFAEDKCKHHQEGLKKTQIIVKEGKEDEMSKV